MIKRLRDKSDLTNSRIIVLFFAVLIFLGALLLSLPISSKSGEWTPFTDSLFTAVSSACVTGLVVFDTFSYWTFFGQLVIISLIQTGGLGVMTVITMFSIFLKKRISLRERTLLVQSAGTMRLSGVVKLILRILKGTLLVESVGAFLLSLRFIPRMGYAKGIYFAVFHSISAFCNAGFDLMGKFGEFSSLTSFHNDIIVNLTICSLIITGGLGFLVWDDLIAHKLDYKSYSLHTKIVLSASAVLIFSGFFLFFVFERGASMSGMSVGERVLASLFQSVTTRTAGFNTIKIGELSDSGSLLSVILMFIGGSPGSTAGGIKTTTLVVLLVSTLSVSRHSENIDIFKRRLNNDIIKQANAVFIFYLSAALLSVLVVCSVETYSLKEITFEVVSAIGTVGLSYGITPHLKDLSKVILMFLMYGGRVGGLSLMLALAEKRVKLLVKRPSEKILIG